MTTVLGETRPVARIEHQCDACSRTINPGEMYTRQRNIDHVQAWTHKMCWHCGVMWVDFIWPHLHETCQEENNPYWSTGEAMYYIADNNSIPLGILTRAAKQQWQRADNQQLFDHGDIIKLTERGK